MSGHSSSRGTDLTFGIPYLPFAKSARLVTRLRRQSLPVRAFLSLFLISIRQDRSSLATPTKKPREAHD